MTPAERAALLRFGAAMHRRAAARLTLGASAVLTAESVRGLAAAFARSERQEFEQHPDVQEAVLGMQGWYSP